MCCESAFLSEKVHIRPRDLYPTFHTIHILYIQRANILYLCIRSQVHGMWDTG